MSIVCSVIVVEDDLQYRDSLVTFLSKSGFDAVGVPNAVEFYQEVHARPYALAVIDLGLPDQNGLVLAEYLRKNTSMRVVILSGRSELEDRIAGYGAGADLYLLKPAAFAEIAAALSSLCARCAAAEGTSAEEHHAWRLIKGQWVLVVPTGDQVQLSAKEYQFLACLAEEPMAIVSREVICDELGYENTLQGHKAMEALIYRLRKKIPHSFGDAIKTASAMGYSFAFPIDIE